MKAPIEIIWYKYSYTKLVNTNKAKSEAGPNLLLGDVPPQCKQSIKFQCWVSNILLHSLLSPIKQYGCLQYLLIVENPQLKADHSLCWIQHSFIWVELPSEYQITLKPKQNIHKIQHSKFCRKKDFAHFNLNLCIFFITFRC